MTNNEDKNIEEVLNSLKLEKLKPLFLEYQTYIKQLDYKIEKQIEPACKELIAKFGVHNLPISREGLVFHLSHARSEGVDLFFKEYMFIVRQLIDLQIEIIAKLKRYTLNEKDINRDFSKFINNIVEGKYDEILTPTLLNFYKTYAYELLLMRFIRNRLKKRGGLVCSIIFENGQELVQVDCEFNKDILDKDKLLKELSIQKGDKIDASTNNLTLRVIEIVKKISWIFKHFNNIISDILFEADIKVGRG